MKRKFLNLLICIAALAGGAVMASAQSGGGFSISHSTTDGGGGPGAGGGFSLNGTVGQPDAGAMSGGAFTINGGFWPGITGGSMETTPGLSIRLGTPMAGANTVILGWPNSSTGYVLQQTANMSGPGGGWVDVTQPPFVVGPNKEVTLPATGHFCMFRLRKI